MTTHSLDIRGFAAVHDVVAGGGASMAVAAGLADWGIFVVPVVLGWLWVRGGSHARLATIAATLSAGCALAFAGLLSFAVFVPRPFAAGLSDNLLAHVADSSFPSDHATVMIAVATALFLGGCRRSGLLVGAFAVATGLSRIALGVHFPSDILAGAIIGAGVAAAFRLAALADFVEFAQRIAYAAYVQLGIERIAVRLHVERQAGGTKFR